MTEQPSFTSRADADAYIAEQLRAGQPAGAAVPQPPAEGFASRAEATAFAGDQIAAGQAPKSGPTDSELGAHMAAEGAAAGGLPHEATMDDLMAEFRAMAARMEGLEKELAVTKAAQVAGRAPDDLVLYAINASAWLHIHHLMNGDLPLGHFDKVRAAGEALAAAAIATTGHDGEGKETGEPADLGQLTAVRQSVAAIERFIGRTHPRLGRKHVDFSVVEYDLEMILEAADKLAPAA
jgi:hypothetical protein